MQVCATLLSCSLPSSMLHHQLHQVFLLCQESISRGEMIHLAQFLDPRETCREQPRGAADKKLFERSRVHLAGRGSSASCDAVKLARCKEEDGPQRCNSDGALLQCSLLQTTAANERGILLLCVLDKLNS